jgi:hypothetical protein
MRFPTLRYGNPNEFAAYVQGQPLAAISKRLRRSERSIKDWLTGRKKMPWWVPEIIRLQNMEAAERMRQMNMVPIRAALRLAPAGQVLEFPAPAAPRASAPASCGFPAAQSGVAAGLDPLEAIAAASRQSHKSPLR